MISASELLASAHESDRQLKELSEAAEQLRLAEPVLREVQRKLGKLHEAARAVDRNKPLQAQLGVSSSASINSAGSIARQINEYIGLLYAGRRLDELI